MGVKLHGYVQWENADHGYGGYSLPSTVTKKTETEAVEKIGKQPPSQTQLAARASPGLLFANAQSTPSTRPETPTRFVLSTEDPPSGRSSLVAEAFQPPAPG